MKAVLAAAALTALCLGAGAASSAPAPAVHEHTSAVSVTPGCTMPADFNNQKPGECRVTRSAIREGIRQVVTGDGCYQVEDTLDHITPVRMHGTVLDLPRVRTQVRSVPCRA